MANNELGIGECSPNGSTRASKSAGGSGGQRRAGKQRRRQSSPVIPLASSDDPGAAQTRGHRSRTNPICMDQTSVAASPPSVSMPGTAKELLKQASIKDESIKMPATNNQKPAHFQEIDRILREIDPRGADMAEGLEHAPESPPITPDSLAELEMPRIINNPKLRHDVNFDRELHFRPNFDGFKGKQKLESAEMYWKALEGELVMCAFVQGRKSDADYVDKEAHWKEILTASLRRLPKIFKAVGDILGTLVPDYDQHGIAERLDVDLIMREISHGVCDLVDLAKWLGQVLKMHCAPMRDDVVNRMRDEITRGATQQHTMRLVHGLKQLLNVLECMKLDVANHQIRHMRAILVEDSVNFQKHYNKHRVERGKIDCWNAKVWLELEMEHIRARNGGEYEPSYVEGVASGLLRSLIFPLYAPDYPNTFYLDIERLRALRLDMQNIIFSMICREVLTEMAGKRAAPLELAQAIAALDISVSAIVGPMGHFTQNLENIAVEIMRITLMLEGRPNASYDAVLLDAITERLEDELRTGSRLHERYSYVLLERILPKVTAAAEHDVRLTALQLQDKHVPRLDNSPIMTHPMGYGYGAVCSPVMNTPSVDPDDSLVRRFTHIIALHWQIWGDVVYLQTFDDLDLMSTQAGQDPPDDLMVPVAQAVYAPGHKWLPVGVTVTYVPTGSSSSDPAPRPNGHEKKGTEEQKDEQASNDKSDLASGGQQRQST